ncbi:MAG: hypothetical protein KKG09_06760 [Verrucomicrobia bacterium]|nr:hypothetical protein [Verrucomicrobiota bacterium]MBU4247189.1 hypothetical protein [Verrucomicrobiota bacterium]MBU4291360.1 hypothetical protein [Verrucomicrobiota bacterium]MBU4497684.1 hypothetical protein [Verrucomicrobiota bacterium]MCG2680676.1 hypothetical protein [Kiritimatiellia bacterium]
MRRKLYILALCACGLVAASRAEQNEKSIYMGFGMTRDSFRTVKPYTMKIDKEFGSRNTNDVVLIEIKKGSPIAIMYHFIDDRLRAVTLGQLYFGKRDGQEIKRVHDALIRELVRKSDETVIRRDENMQPIRVSAELWTYEKNGIDIYFLDTSNEITIIAFDPKYFVKRDFFMTPEEMPKF